MNTTIDTTEITSNSTTEVSTLTAGPARNRRGSGRLGARARRLTLGVLAATSGILGGAAGLLPASEASAQAIVTPYFSLDATVTCDQFRNTVTMTVSAGPQPAYRGMTVQFQTYLELGNTASWGTWSRTAQLWNHGQLASASMSVPNNTNVRMYVQMRYWTGSRWSTPQGTWATPYLISHVDYRTPYFNGFCYT